MYKYRKPSKTSLQCISFIEGEPMELKVRRIMDNKEPIKDAAPLIYTDRKEGVNAAYNIKTDRFEVAADAMDKVHRSRIAKRDEANKAMKEVVKEIKEMKPTSEIGKTEPTAGTVTK